MTAVQVINNISNVGLKNFPSTLYEVEVEHDAPDVVLLRSTSLHDAKFSDNLLAVGRAGAGTNNIPIARLTEMGVAVFNTPGANANSVKELVIAGMLLASRHIGDAWVYTHGLEGSAEEVAAQVEAGKKQFAGGELLGKTLGVIGLGAIGRSVANIGIELGMKVVGFDPGLTVEGAWQLSADVKQAKTQKDVFKQADFLTFHVPLIDATKDMVNAESLKWLPKGATLLNFARNGIIDDEAAKQSLESGHLGAYVTDFPNLTLMGVEGVIALPHLGASTSEAEENCATMIVDQIRDFVENGNVRNSVNFPEVVLAKTTPCRLAIVNRNQPNMVAQISADLAKHHININDMVNQSRGEIAYTLIDTDDEVSEGTLNEIRELGGILNARIICGN